MPRGERQIGERPHLSGRAGIVEGDVEPAEAAQRRLDERFREALVAHVAGDGNGLAARFRDLRDKRIELRLPPGRHHDAGALPGEELRRRATDPGACAGDDGDLVCERGHL